jgi:hypothetical protein
VTGLVPMAAEACSLAGCLNDGLELQRTFVVSVKHGGKPLAGVRVGIRENGESKLSAITGPDGNARITNLVPGEYWLDTDLLGISAGSQCFHIASRASFLAKKHVAYAWGDLAPGFRRAAGRLIDSEPGRGENPIWNLIHRVEVPIREAHLRLQDPINSTAFEATSAKDGSFSFDGIPNGTYVLHVEGGQSGRDYDNTDQLITIGPTAKRDTLLLVRRDAGGGSCGGTGLELW